MKRIPLGTIHLPARGGQPPAEITYVETLREILFAGGRDGLTTAQMLTSLEAWQMIKAAADFPSVLLEEAQYQHLVQRLEAFRWAGGGEEAAAFVLAIRNAETVNLNKAAAA